MECMDGNCKSGEFQKNMEDLNLLRDLKSYILDFEYPLANSMNDEELADIFKHSNRGFLISWMLKLVGYNDETVSAEDIKLSGTILYENGFCTKEQIIPFMVGSLDPLEQLKILQNLFIYIKTIRKQDSNTFRKCVSLNDIESISKKNLNLFPMYGEIKLLNTGNPPPTKTEKIKEECKDTVGGTDDINIAKLIEDICLELPNIKNIANNSPKHNNNQITPCTEADDVYKTCNKHLKQVYQFVKDIKTIEEFNKVDHTWLMDKDNNFSKTNRELLKELCDEIRNILRCQRTKKI